MVRMYYDDIDIGNPEIWKLLNLNLFQKFLC